MNAYDVKLEISGPSAMWTRPDTGSSPVSYVVPTFSAVKGIFESILRWKSVNIHPTKVEICAPIQFHNYATNYGGPLRASDAITNGVAFQFHAVILVNVCYRVYAYAEFANHHKSTTCPPHAYQERFNKKLERGQWFHLPCLGWKEFVPTYVGNFRPETRVCETENHDLPSMLKMVFNQTGYVQPYFYNKLNQPKLCVEKGVFTYA